MKAASERDEVPPGLEHANARGLGDAGRRLTLCDIALAASIHHLGGT